MSLPAEAPRVGRDLTDYTDLFVFLTQTVATG